MSVSIFTNDSNGHTGSKFHLENHDRVDATINFLKKNLPLDLFKERNIRNEIEAIELIYNVHGDDYLSKIYNKPEFCKCTQCHLEHVEEICPSCENKIYYWYPKPDTYMTNKSIDVIKDAILAIKDGIDSLEITPYVYMLIRPPNHHCNDKINGFCLVNGTVIAAKYAQSKGYKKIVILDWDFHHFNGTSTFLNETICGVSIHAYGDHVYPFTGNVDENNDYTLNIPLMLKTDDDFLRYTDAVYLDIVDRQVMPFIMDNSPDLIIISNGLDAHRDDPIGGMNITNKFFIDTTNKLKNLKLPLFYVLEGGYNINVIKNASLDIVNELLR